ncbi:LysR family transcriptional regulator [Glacieibacterium sp.]|uniref:LysR family transcriptional regulator n=1 Tax=Glacieibacterium sp. TaxID=2860237 RepID=UPI003AFFE4F7
MKGLSFRQLRAVEAVGRLRRIILAARELGLTASAVTLQIQLAETEAGAVLFERMSDGMRMTDAGQAFVRAAQEVDQRLRLLADELAAIATGGRGRLTLGAVSTAKYFAPRLIAAFTAFNPGIEVKLVIGNRAETIDAMDNRAIDIALMGRPPRQLPDRTYLVGDHPLVIIAHPAHPLAKQRQITKTQIAAEKFLIREPGSGTRLSLELFLAEIAGRLDDLGDEFRSNETIKQAVMARLGIAFISAHTIELETELGLLAILDVVGMPIHRQWFAVCRADRMLSPAMAKFKDFASQHGHEFLPRIGMVDDGRRGKTAAAE